MSRGKQTKAIAVKAVDISQNTLQFISFSHIANYAHVCM